MHQPIIQKSTEQHQHEASVNKVLAILCSFATIFFLCTLITASNGRITNVSFDQLAWVAAGASVAGGFAMTFLLGYIVNQKYLR